MSNGVTFKLIEKNKSGVISALKNAAKDEKAAYVGVQKDSKPRTDTLVTNAEVAMANEFGTDTIPERSFIRSTLHEKMQSYKDFAKKALKKVLNSGKDAEKAKNLYLSKLGETAEGDIRVKITEITVPKLAESTIAARKRKALAGATSKKARARIENAALDKPLIDSGQMKDSIRYKVMTRKEAEK